jgi:glyoxylase-like metal-dependent hydrolase (beta-lactamase superfamily II)
VETTLFGKPPRFAGGLQEIAAGVFAWLQPNGEWGESNGGLVVGDGTSLLIDTLWDVRLTRRMLAAMAEPTRHAPIETVLNTHSDGDHVWGNQLLYGAEIVSTQAAAAIIREEPPAALIRLQRLAPRLRRLGALPLPVLGRLTLPGVPRLPLGELGTYVERMLSPYDFSEVRVTPPTREWSGELTLAVGGRELRVLEVGPAHTPGDAIVHLPDASVVFAADILFVGVTPVMWAGPTSNWIRALERIIELAPAVVVPGHGPVSGTEEVALLRDYLEWVDTGANRELESGRSVSETARELVGSAEYRAARWADWDGPERIVVTIAAIDRRRRGTGGPVGARERAAIFARVASLARELEGRGGAEHGG